MDVVFKTRKNQQYVFVFKTPKNQQSTPILKTQQSHLFLKTGKKMKKQNLKKKS